MKVTRNTHKIYKEWIASGKAFRQIVGKYQYIYTSPKGKISCVNFLDYMFKGDNFWEIYSLEGNFFDDVERYDTKKEAEKRIKDLLK